MTKKNMNNQFKEQDVTQNPQYHNTLLLLKKYRDVVWSLEISVRQVENKFRMEYGSSIENFLDNIYLAGADLCGSKLEHQAKCIEQTNQMIQLLESAIEILRHKHGEIFYWIIFYTYLSPQQLKNIDEVIDSLAAHIKDISYREYYRKRKEAIEALSSILWGYTTQECQQVLDNFLPNNQN